MNTDGAGAEDFAYSAGILLETDDLRVEFFRTARPTTQSLAFTFTGWGERERSGYGYGGRFLLKEGYDVVAFKLVEDNWYQSVPERVFERIDACLAGRAYRQRVAYGSSMGGYAAIQFSRTLACDIVLAFSPQYRIDQDFDTGYAEWAKRIDFRYFITADSIAPGCRYFVLYDSREEDRLHMDRLRLFIPPAQLVAQPIPWAGHPVDVFLSQVGLLKAVPSQVFARASLDGFSFREARARSTAYHVSLSLALAARSKDAAALELIDRAIGMNADVSGYHGHRSVLLERLGRVPEALASVRRALELDPGNADMVSYLEHLQAQDPD